MGFSSPAGDACNIPCRTLVPLRGGCDGLAVLSRLSACDMAVCIESYMCITSQLHFVRDYFVGMHELPFMYCSALGRASGTGTGRVEGGREGQLRIGPRLLWST